MVYKVRRCVCGIQVYNTVLVPNGKKLQSKVKERRVEKRAQGPKKNQNKFNTCSYSRIRLLGAFILRL